MTMLLKPSNKGKHYRNKQEIIYLILSCIGQRGVRITYVLYHAYLSYNQCREYLAELTRLGLLSFNEDSKMYRVTAKGEHFMQIYSVLREQLK